MLVKHLFENEVTDPKRPFKVEGMYWHFGRRDRELVKQIFTPFQKEFDQEMKALKGKWNGNGGPHGQSGTYDFKTEEQAKAAKEKVAEFRERLKDLLKEYPEGAMSNGAHEFFKHQAKVDKSFKK